MTMDATALSESVFPQLGTPGRIGTLTVPNRMVFAATSSELAAEDGTVTDRLIDFYVARGRGGVGLVITEATFVDPVGKRLEHNLMIDDDRYLPGLTRLATAVKAAGARVAIQLEHAGRESIVPVTGRVVAPSPIPSAYTGIGASTIPDELTIAEIRQIIGRFASAAARAVAAGFDAVELHGAHGYLMNQFLSPDANHRSDEYGGSLEGRARFFVELLTAVRGAVGPNFPVICRVNGRDGMPGGLELDDAIAAAELLEAAGADAISVSGGTHASRPYGIVPGMSQPRGVYLPYADAFRPHLSVPLMIVGRIKTPELAEQVLADGRADFVCLSRALIADPEFPAKALRGVAGDIVPCIACNECIANVHRHGGIVCTMNPSLGREEEVRIALATPVIPLRVVVIGGGVAGAAAAVAAARRGHRVTLLEQSASIGGQLRIAHLPPHREELADALEWFRREVDRLDIDVRLGEAPTRATVEALRPEQIIVAIGARPRRPDIPGADLPHVTGGWEVLSGDVTTGDTVAVLGGGLVGVEVADFLADQGRTVVLVARSGILQKAVHADRVYYVDRIAELGIEALTETAVLRIEQGGVTVQPAHGVRRTLAVDSVVLCTGYAPKEDEARALVPEGVPVSWVGDVLGSRKLFQAIEEGTRAGLAV